MQDLNDKMTGDQLTADEWNEMPSELQNIIESTGQTLNGGDLNQVGKGVAQYAGNGDFYTDSGAADAYILTTLNLKQAFEAYADGTRIRYIPTNTNTGASTVNVAGKGIRNIKTVTGSDPAAGDLLLGRETVLSYNLATTNFVIQTVPFASNSDALAKTSTSKALTPSNLAAINATETFSGLAEIATQAEVDGAADATRYVTPVTLANSPAIGGLSFRANNSAQVIPVSTITKVQFDVEEWDTNSDYDITFFRYTPTVPGKYSIHGRITYSNADVDVSLRIDIYKNGASHSTKIVKSASVVSTNAIDITDLVDMDGAGDFVEIWTSQISVAGASLATGTAVNTFVGHRVSV